MTELVEYETAGPIATIWLNRPEVRNAFDISTMRALRRAVVRAEADQQVTVVVLRGRGDSFCAGGDVRMLESGQSWDDGASSWVEFSLFTGRALGRLTDCAKVTIAAVHGWTIAGGFELMLACDLAVAAEDARIGDFHLRNGLFAGGGAAHRVTRLIGLRRARELMLSAEILDGRRALEWGLVNAIAPLDELDALVESFAAKFSDKSPTVTRLTKLVLGRSRETDAETMKLIEALTSGVVGATPDPTEGIAAFREKRPAKWAVLPAVLDEDDQH